MVLFAVAAGLAWLNAPVLVPNASGAGVSEPDYNAPWPEAEAKGLWQPAAEQTGAVQYELAMASDAESMNDPGASSEPESSSDTEPAAEMLPPAALPPPEIKVTKHEVSASADFLLGEGDVTVPLGFSLAPALPAQVHFTPRVASAKRSSEYLGASLSYSYGQAWYLDLAYATGDSSGNVGLSELDIDNAEFSIKDDWYQAYLRYTFPSLRGKRLSAYLRAGVTYIQADLNVQSTLPPFGFYVQDDKTEDLRGNLGFGLLYSLHAGRHFRVGLQLEGEGFYGSRSQESLERLPQRPYVTSSVILDNTLYGGLGRGTVRFEYRVGRSGLLKVFADGGVQVTYTFIDYPEEGRFSATSFEELLWGPYVKVGLRYAF